MAYDLIKISALPEATPDESQEIVVGVGDYAKRINYGDVKADMVGTSPTYTTDTEPYLMRQTKNVGVVGKCALNKLIGGSLGWNQLATIASSSKSTTANNVTITDNRDGSYTVSTTASGASANTYITIPAVAIIADHKYLVKGTPSGGGASTYYNYLTGSGIIEAKNDYGNGYIAKGLSNGSANYVAVYVKSGAVITTAVKFYPNTFDLTQTFGSTIADYVYGLEQATAGAGVAWLSRYIDLSTYHTYDIGSIQSVQATAHVTKDANDNVIGNYPLGSDTLRGIPQLVSNKLAYNGDEKYPDGTIRRKYGIVDLGSLTWVYDTTKATPIFTAATNTINPPIKTNSSHMISGRHTPLYRFWETAGNDKRVATGTSGLNISDSAYTTAEAFKSAMSSVYLVYELATESTESSTAYQKIQTIDADGTESFTTSSPVPVGHETQTPDNILAALEWLGE